MKVKEKDYEDIYWCIVTDQVPEKLLMNTLKIKIFTDIML